MLWRGICLCEGPLQDLEGAAAAFQMIVNSPPTPQPAFLETEMIAVGAEFDYNPDEIPRSAFHPPMEITVQINPYPVYYASDSPITLTIREYPTATYKRILNPVVKKDFTTHTFIFRWDGKLYQYNENGQEIGDPIYPRRTDMAMTAKVTLRMRQLDAQGDSVVVNQDFDLNNIAFSFPGPASPFFDVRERFKFSAYLWNDRVYFHGAERIPAGPDNDGSDNYRVGYWIKSGSDKVRAYVKYCGDTQYQNMVELTTNVQWFYFNQHGEGVWEDVPEEIVIDSIDLTPSSQIGDIQIGYHLNFAFESEKKG